MNVKKKKKLKESLSKSLYTIKHPKTFLFHKSPERFDQCRSSYFCIEKALVPYFLKKMLSQKRYPNEKETVTLRLDKYLKVSRIIKRRPVAKEVADKGRIKVNGVLAKSSTDLKIGDQVEVRFGNKLLTVRVLEMKDSTKKEDATKMYEIISETRIEADEQEA